jgi:enoyl-CoA hydratase/carnithine racemase
VRELADGRLRLDEPAPDVARLTIANPAKRNALDQTILDAIASVVRGLDARCVVLTGS